MSAPGGGIVEADGALRVRVLSADDRGPELALVEGRGYARAIVWPGLGARTRSLHRIVLEPGARTIGMRHEMEAVYFVREGVATVQDDDAGEVHPVPAGSMIFVEPHTAYRIAADGQAVEVVGGPCPPDPALYELEDPA